MTGLPGVGFTATAVAGAPARPTVETQPSAGARTGVVLSGQPRVQLQDAGGNLSAADDIEVTAVLGNDPGGSLAGTTTILTRGGRATFTDLSITGAVGSYTLQFTSPGLTGTTSAAIALSAGDPAALTIRRQPPATAVSWQPLSTQPIVEVRDGGGNLLDGVGVDASIQGGGRLTGGARATANQGVATFTP